jgi:hypothetical protein
MADTADVTGVTEVYMAVFARVEDGQIKWLSIDDEALVGSYDGFIWDPDTEGWHREWNADCDAARGLLSAAVDAANARLATTEA